MISLDTAAKYEKGTYHVKTDDLSIRLLDLSQFHEEIPKPRFGHDCIGGKDAHSI